MIRMSDSEKVRDEKVREIMFKKYPNGYDDSCLKNEFLIQSWAINKLLVALGTFASPDCIDDIKQTISEIKETKLI